jgi:CRISPR-associated protein Cmr1
MSMQKVSFECEVITPMFLGGADQQPELRAPSIKGAMRWWFRAMMGGTLWDRFPDDTAFISEVRKKEAQLFGDTSISGEFSLLVREQPTDNDLQTFDFPINDPNKIFLRYIGYGLYEKGSERKYIKPGFRFSIEVRFHSQDPDVRKLILGSLWMLCNFGGIGARASRGFGSFSIYNSNVADFDVVSSLGDLEDGLKKVASAFGIPSRSSKNPLAPYSIVHPSAWEMVILTSPKSSAVEALNFIGQCLREHREDKSSPFSRTIRTRDGRTKTIRGFHSREYSNVIKSKPASGVAGSVGLPTTSIYGLPHPFQFSSYPKVTIECENRDRRMSPLHIHVHRFGSDYFISLQKFESTFVDGNIKFYAPDNKGNFEIVGGNLTYAEINNFMASASLGITRSVSL